MKRTLEIIFLILLIAVCLTTLLAAYGGMFNPEYFFAIPAMVSMTFPIWIVVLPVMALISVFIKHRMALIPVATMIICIGPFLDFCPLNFTREQPDNDPGFTLLTYNVFGSSNYLNPSEKIEHNSSIQTILDTNADIVCLQETRVIKEEKRFGVTPEIIDSLYTRYPYRIYNNTSLGVLSKYPVDTIPAPLLPGNSASMLIADILVAGEHVRVYNLHLQSIGLTNDDKELYKEITRGKADNHLKKAKDNILTKLRAAFKNRSSQAHLIKEIISETYSENMVVCGDFNDIPGCYAMRKIESAGLKNAYTDAGLWAAPTYRADRFYFHIDQILYNNGIKPTDISVLKNAGQSDHLPVLADFEFR